MTLGEAASAVGGRTFRRVFDEIGRAVISRELPTGSVVSVDWVIEQTGASRSVVREATRVLASLGLLVARQRVGLTVAPSEAWNALDGDVVRWRLESTEREAQIADLLELRLAVEPAAARAAAERTTDEQATALLAAGERLERATVRHDANAFFEADSEFHRLVIAAGGNRMFVRLESVLREALRERTPHAPVRWQNAIADAQLHAQLANAIGRRQPAEAEVLMKQIVRG